MPTYDHIERYREELDRLIVFGGSTNEQSIRPAFQNCLDAYCREHRERLMLANGQRHSGRHGQGQPADAARLTSSVFAPTRSTASSLWTNGPPSQGYLPQPGNTDSAAAPRSNVLDQYKEKKPRDPTIRERFNTYRFADHKEKVIDLLRRVCTVSARTTEVVEEMRGLAR